MLPLLDDDITAASTDSRAACTRLQCATRKASLYNMCGLAVETAESWSDRSANIGPVSTFAGANETECLDL